MVGTTIGSRLAETKGFGPGFDFLRIVLALGVVVSHSWQLLYNDVSHMGAFWFVRYSILPIFFALSGFLVTGSALRLNIRDFLVNRGARIVPALFVEIFLSALLLGPILTDKTLVEYFADPRFFSYFWNIIGFIHYDLPGVFRGNPFTGVVNGSLWTIPHEIACYALMSLAIVFGTFSSRRNVVISSGIFILCLVALMLIRRFPLGELAQIANVISTSVTQLVVYFVAGCLAYIFRDRIPYSTPIFLFCCVCYVAICFVGNYAWADSAFLMRPLTAPLFVYLVVFIGASRIPKIPLFSRGDYSYGIYLYGFPLQQTLIMLLYPHLSFLTFAAASIIVSTAFAMISWHVVEKPALRIRKSFSMTMQNHASPQPLGIPISESVKGGSNVPKAAG